MSDTDLNIYKVRFCFSPTWKAPTIPLVGIDQGFIERRSSELNICFSEVEEKLSSIDASSNQGHIDLITAVHVIEELRRYKFSVIPVENKGKAYVPYTASNKKRHGD